MIQKINDTIIKCYNLQVKFYNLTYRQNNNFLFEILT